MQLAVSGGQPLFTLGLPMFALSLVVFLSLLWATSTNIYFLVKSTIWRTHKSPCRFKTWLGFVGQILIKLRTSSICFSSVAVWCPLRSNLCKHAGDHSVTTEACTSPHITCHGLCGIEVWKLIGVISTMHTFINRPKLCKLNGGIMLIFVSEKIGHYFWRRVYSCDTHLYIYYSKGISISICSGSNLYPLYCLTLHFTL